MPGSSQISGHVVYKIMRDRDISGLAFLSHTCSGCVLVLLCVCVVAQMLGAPFTLLMDSISSQSRNPSEDMTVLAVA